MFIGEIWVGEKVIEVGFVDVVGYLVLMMKEKFGEKVCFCCYE